MYMYVLALYYFMMIACDPVRGWGFYFLPMCRLSTGAPVHHSTEPTDRDVIYLSDVIYRDKGVQTTRGRHMSE